MAPTTNLHSACIDARFSIVLHMLLKTSKRCYQYNKAADKFRNCLRIEPKVFRVPLEPCICNLRATFFKLFVSSNLAHPPDLGFWAVDGRFAAKRLACFLGDSFDQHCWSRMHLHPF